MRARQILASRTSRLINSPCRVHRRRLHLAPPFLLDPPFIPALTQLPASQISIKRDQALEHLRNCNLCPRLCSVNRLGADDPSPPDTSASHGTSPRIGTGACLTPPGLRFPVSTIAPHFGEEPCIQGHNGSGSVFLAGCNMRCVFCQNHSIAHTGSGMMLSPSELADWLVKLRDVGGVHNVNFVTPEHVVPYLVLALLKLREDQEEGVDRGKGLGLPVVYNTSAYDSLESLELLDGLVDIYLPDFKVWDAVTGRRLLKVEKYPDHARKSIKKMQEQVGDLCFTPDGIACKGLLVRHLVMPDGEEDGCEIMKWIAEEVSRDTVVNTMEQYKPDAHVGKTNIRGGNTKEGKKPRYHDIDRPASTQEVRSVRKSAELAGLWRFIEPARHGGWNM